MITAFYILTWLLVAGAVTVAAGFVMGWSDREL